MKMQPFVNPNYFSYQQPYNQPMQQNPYDNRLMQLQQMQQSLQTPQNQISAMGNIVENLDIVKTTNIPMDGNTYYFPKADGTELYTKQWLPDGRTRILTFKPILDNDTEKNTPNEFENQISAFKDVLGGIQTDIQALNDKIDKITKPARSKKEIVEDE